MVINVIFPSYDTVWYDEILVAEINQETEKLEIEFYLTGKMTFNLDEFLETLEIAKTKII